MAVQYQRYACGDFNLNFGRLLKGDRLTFNVLEYIERPRSSNVVAIVRGWAKFVEHPKEFTPVEMRAGMANLDIPDYPPGKYTFEAQTDEYWFFCCSHIARPHPFERRTVVFPDTEVFRLEVGEVAVFNVGGFADRGEESFAPAIAWAKNEPLELVVRPGSKCIVLGCTE